MEGVGRRGDSLVKGVSAPWMGLWHSQPCQKACLSRQRARKRKAETFGGGGGKERKRKAEEEEKKKQKLDKSLHKELGKSSSTSRSASESSEGRGRSQPVKLTPAPTAVEKTVVKEEPDWSEESEAPKKGKKRAQA